MKPAGSVTMRTVQFLSFFSVLCVDSTATTAVFCFFLCVLLLLFSEITPWTLNHCVWINEITTMLILILCSLVNKVNTQGQLRFLGIVSLCISWAKQWDQLETCWLTSSPPMSVRTQPGCSTENRIPSFFSSSAAQSVSMFKPACEGEEWEDNEVMGEQLLLPHSAFLFIKPLSSRSQC